MLRANLLSFGLGPVTAAAVSFLSIPLVAWYFPAEAIGRVTVFQTVVSLAMLIFTLGLDQVYVREFHERSDNRGTLWKQCFTPGFVVLVIALAALLPFSNEAAELLYDTTDRSLFLLTLVAIILTFAGRFLSLILRMQERGFAYSLGQTLPRFAFLLTLGTYVALQARPTTAKLLAAHVVIAVATFALYAWSARVEIASLTSDAIEVANVRMLLAQGAPLIGAGIAYWGVTSAGTIALRVVGDFESLGIYALAQSIAGIAVIVQTIFSTVWMPTVYKWAQSKHDLDRIHDVRTLLFFLIIVVFCLVGICAPILDMLLPPEYAAVKWIILCSIAQPLLYTLSETTVAGLNIERKTSLAFVVSAASFASAAILCVALVPRFGAAGAASATAMASFVFFVARTRLSARYLPVAHQLPMFCWLLIIVIAACSFALTGEMAATYSPGAWLFLLAVAFYMHRNLAARALRAVRERWTI